VLLTRPSVPIKTRSFDWNRGERGPPAPRAALPLLLLSPTFYPKALLLERGKGGNYHFSIFKMVFILFFYHKLIL
jgi:hypothetical protein